QQLDSGLRLARLGGLGAEALDKSLQPLALGIHPLGELEVERLALAALTLEGAVAAAVERQLSGLEVENPIDRAVEQVAVVADDDDRARIARDALLQP